MFERIDPMFEPSSQTREAMLFVRKKPLLLSGIKHPGMFGIHAYTVDWVLFLVVLILETIGLYSFYNALEQSDTSIFTALMATGAMLVVDFVFAFYHHRFATGINSKLEIENIIASQKKSTEANILLQNNEDIIQNRMNKSFIFSTLLILLAAAKFGVFYMLNEGNGEIEYGAIAFMAVAYLLAAIIHIKATGFLLHAVWANWLYGRDVKSFKTSNGNACRATERLIELDEHIDYQQGIEVRTHSVICESKPGSEEKVYMLKTLGMLMDKDIEELSFKIKNDNARSHLVKKAMEIQTLLV